MKTDILTGIIEKVVPGGLRLVRGEQGIIFLDGGLPGETVSFQVHKKQKGTAYGEVQQIINASDTRVTPECQYYVDCGGCSLLETKPNNRRHIKQAMLEEALSRIGKIDLKGASFLKEIQFEPQPQGRIRATIHIAPDGRFGFFASQSHNLVAIEQCLALHPFLQKFIQSLSEQPCPPLQTEWRLQIACDPTGSVQAAIHDLSPEQQQEVANHLLSNTTMEGVHLIHEDGHTLTTEGKTNLRHLVACNHPAGPFQHDPATFTQSSFWGSQILLDTVHNLLETIDSPLETCIELFSGAGHFSFLLLDHVEDLLCIEGDPRAFFWLAENRGKHPKQDQMEIWQTKVDGQRVDLLPDVCPIDLLFLDPPREGVKHIAGITDALQPRHIILVSCDLASGARDLGLLQRNGYTIQKLQPLDIFAHNHHLEWVAWLTRSSEEFHVKN